MNKIIGNYRWQIITLLFFATTINYIDRQVIGLLKPYIEKDLGWTEIDYGHIVTAFQVAYAIGLLISGRFLDKFGTRLGYSVSIVIWSLGGMFHAVVRSVFGFGSARFILGIGEAGNFPAAVKTVAEWFPRKERALATGIFNSGSNIGAILAPIIVTFVTISFGWRWAFIVTGLLGFIWLLFWIFLYRTPLKHPKITKNELDYILSDNEEIKGESMKLKVLLRLRQTYGICLSRFVTEWVWWFFLYWAPDFLKKSQGVNIREMVLPLIIIYTFASFGGIGGGWVSGHFIKIGKSTDKARKTSILLCALIVLPLIFAPVVSNIWLSVILISMAAAAHQGWAANIFTITSDIFPKNTVGTVMGIAGFFGAVSGAISATLIGTILENTGSYFVVFAIAAGTYLIAWLILKVMIPEIRPLEHI